MDEDEDLDVTVLVAGYQIPVADLPKMGLRMANLAEANGFEVKAGHSRFFERAKLFKNDGKTGQRGEVKTPERTVENHWIDAVNRERKIKFTAVWHDGSFETGWVGLQPYKSTALNKLIKGED